MARGDKRTQIMKAAEKLFTSRRFHEITMADVAGAAQIGKGTIYQYFKDKDDLFFQVTTSGFEELCDLLHRRVPSNAPFAEQLVDVCTEIHRFFESRRQLFRMMQSEDARIRMCRGHVHEQWAERHAKLVAAVAVVIRKGVAEGAIRPDVPPEILAGYLLGMLRTRARELVVAGVLGDTLRQGVPTEIGVLVNLFRYGAGPQL